MPAEGSHAIALTDSAGNCYVLTREMLDSARVPDEQTAEVRAATADASGDTLGFGTPGMTMLGPLQVLPNPNIAGYLNLQGQRSMSYYHPIPSPGAQGQPQP